jgi:glycosyltransferase involved in cell wall biosynthesis
LIPVAFCIPGDLALRTGGYRYDRELLKRFSNHGVQASHVMLSSGFPNPTDRDISDAKAKFLAEDRKKILLIDGLALGAMPPQMLRALPHNIVALVHHPLGLETGLSKERAEILLKNEKAVLADVRHIIVTSKITAKALEQDFSLPRRKITIAEPGTARASRARGTGKPLQIMALGAVSARKAYDTLVAALAPLEALNWQLSIAGSLTHDLQAVEQLRSVIAYNGLEQRVTLTGAISDSEVASLYDQADLFAMSSFYEGYGMALAEAMAHGLPIVTTTGGAAAETVADSAAIKVPPGDVILLSDALGRVLSDEKLRQRMSDASWAAGALLPDWDDTTREIAEALKELS